ncbi:efflux RND transporter periplasmic adaptor subunit [Marinomonas algicola]|uniref:efflux RND transporter periplasmic adaptor subunit n=1 Tax=Marinomonas algicola TaxID=2773454 RepID=UPI00174B7171|nr:efflux RND transporter periplasmic adaptor subunit [Marinomonas algicola]
MKRFLPWILFILMSCLLAGIYVYISSAIEAKNQTTARPRPPAEEQVLDVSVIEVRAQKHVAMLSANGTTKSRFEVNLTAKVSGDVERINPNFETGNRVPAGTELLKLKNLELISNLSQAKNQQAKAILALKEEERLVDQAEAEWKAAGFSGDPDSELVLRKPQLAVAKQTLLEAKNALLEAQEDILNLVIKMPFPGLIVERTISPNTQITTGETVGTVYSTDRIEITLPLSNSDWQKLPSAESMLSQKWPVTIESIDNLTRWEGYVLRTANHIDTTTRMRHIVVAIDAPLEQSPRLLPGRFVTVIIKGKPINDLWRLPSSSLSQNSEIWYIDSDSRLQSFATLPVFSDNKSIYIKAPTTLTTDKQKILIKPYNSYVQGALVNPLEVNSK